jgi:hypothetical protein
MLKKDTTPLNYPLNKRPMRNVFLIACCLCVQFLHSQVDRTLRIVYIDNYSESGSGIKGMSSNSVSYLYGEIDKYMEERFLLYIPNGRKPFYVLDNKDDAMSLLSDISKDRNNFSDVLFDKQVIWYQLSEYADLQFTKIECHFYLSNQFIEENVITDKLGFFTTYFMRELQTAFKAETVQFHYYHNEEEPKLIAKIDSRLKEIFSFDNKGIFDGKLEASIHIIN